MQTIPGFTIEDLVQKPSSGYTHLGGENRVYMIFNTISPEMKRLEEGDNFTYENQNYRILVRISESVTPVPESIQFKCLRLSKEEIDEGNK